MQKANELAKNGPVIVYFSNQDWGKWNAKTYDAKDDEGKPIKVSVIVKNKPNNIGILKKDQPGAEDLATDLARIKGHNNGVLWASAEDYGSSLNILTQKTIHVLIAYKVKYYSQIY